MATYNFTGADGAPLPSGLTVRKGVFEIQSNKGVSTSIHSAIPRSIFTAESQADGGETADIFTGASSGSTAGFALRLNPSDDSHVFVALSVGDDEVKVYTFGGSYSQLDSASLTINANTTYNLSVDMSGDTFTISVDGTPVLTTTSAFNQTQIHHGVRFNEPDQTVDNLNVTDPVGSGGTITIEEAPKNNHPYQRGNNGTATVDFNVAYTGTPTALHYRLLDASDDSTVVQDWATFEASPSGGSSTLSITRSPSLTPIHVEVRFSNDVATAALQTNDWYVGDIVLIFGQSLSEDLNTDGAVTPPAGYFVFGGVNFLTPTTGVGANAIASAIIAAENCPVFVINTGVGGTALTQEAGSTDYWNRASGGSLWPDTVSDIDAATSGANDIAFAWWHQGTKDSLEGVTEAQYLSAMNEFFTRVRSTFTGKGGTLDIIMATFGRDTRGTATNASHQAIRDAQISYIESDANAYPVNVYTSQNEDGVHATDAAYIVLGQQVVTMYYVIRGLVSGSEVVITSASTGDTASEIDITFDADLLSTDSVYSTEGIHVEDDGTPLTVTSFEKKSARVATITVSETPVGTFSVWLAYGKGSTASGLTYPRSEAISLPNSAGDFSLVASAFSDYQVSAQAANVAPTANAGPDQSVVAGVTVQLDASNSTPGTNPIASYEWTQTAGDTVALEDETTAAPSFSAPSTTIAQTIIFSVVAIDSEGNRSVAATVSIDVAAVVLSEVLKIIERLDFELQTQGDVNAYYGRANREVMKLKPSSTEGLVMDGEFLNLESNTITEVKIVADGVSISSKTDAININKSELIPRLGDLDIGKNGNIYFSIIVFVEGDDKGVVVSSKGAAGNKAMIYVTL